MSSGPSEPSERVRSFIADWHEQWAAAIAKMGRNVDFALWRQLVHAVDSRHFAAGAGSGTERSFSMSLPEHGPAFEAVLFEERRGDVAVVETKTDHVLPTFHEYELVQVEGAWKIRALRSYNTARGAPCIVPEARATLLALARSDSPWGELPRGVEPNGERLFEAGRQITRETRTTSTEVRRVGSLQVASGILGVRDLGYAGHGFEPLARRVTAGAHAVDVALAFGRVAAVRVVFDERALIAAWRPATTASGRHVVGVDSGHVAIFDAASFVTLEQRALDRLVYGPIAQPAHYPLAALLTLAQEHDAVAVHSGYGDGGYPCYFGLDSQGQPAVLLVDFLVLAEAKRTVIRIPWQARFLLEPVNHAELDDAGLTICFEPRPPNHVVLHVEGSSFRGARLLHIGSAGEEILVDTARLGGTSQGNERTFRIQRSLDDVPPSTTLEITVDAGYRN